MTRSYTEHEHDGLAGHDAHTAAEPHDDASLHNAESSRDTALATVATVGVVGVAAVVFEAALIPGIILGAAAALAPSVMPKLGSAITPLFRSSVRGAYKIGQKTREVMHEAREHMHDIAAEVEAEGETAVASKTKSHNAAV